MDRPLIVGAGPTGLAAALFLAARGIACRIIDEAAEPTPTSKALGVNPRTLTILAETGLSRTIMDEGRRINTLDIHDEGRSIARIMLDFDAIGADFPMVILPQARTEALLAEALSAHGISIERSLGLQGLVQDEQGVTARLLHADGRLEDARAPILLGADGAHSPVRKALGLGFPGEGMPEDWKLMDVVLTGPEPNAAWIDFQDDGPWVALPFDDKIWRLIGFGPPLLERLPASFSVEKVIWESDFRVSHRMADAMTVGRVALAGDAAHIHSPIGARGMNLGIEDAYVFAHCAAAYLAGDGARLEAYGVNRREIDFGVVRRVERLTRAIRMVKGPGPMLRRLALPVVARHKSLQVMIARQALGLDHALHLP